MTSQTPDTHVDPTPVERDIRALFEELGINLDEDRLTRLASEVESGDRTIDDFRTSLEPYRTTSAATQEIRDLFEELGISIETDDETEEERLTRLTAEVEAGESTLDDFRTALEPHRTTTSPAEQEIIDLYEERGLAIPTGDKLKRLVGEVAGGRTLDDIGTSLNQFGTPVVGDDEFFEGDDEETDLSILIGEDMRWNQDPDTGTWYVIYGMPESDRFLVFEATDKQMDSLFGNGKRPSKGKGQTFDQMLRQPGNTFAGNVGEMEGEGSFEDQVRRVKTLALDNGLLPSWADGSPEIMDLIYIAQAEFKTEEWLIDQIALTRVFQERFVGIDRLRTDGRLTTVEAIAGYLEYEAGVIAAVRAIDSNIEITPEIIGGLLSRSLSVTTVVKAVAKFKRMKDFGPALDAFNRILVDQGMAPITSLQDMFDFVSGTAEADIYDIWEASSITEAAANAGLGSVFNAEDAMAFALQTDGFLSLSDAMGAFQNAAQQILQFRNEIDLGRYGLDQEDLIDLSLGVAPRSGLDTVELQANMSRAVLQGQASQRERAKPFVGFTESGRAQRASLRGLRTTQ